jgi:RNA-directed DNA polymerase
LFERVLQPENLMAAWKKVKANKGAPGIDGISVEEFPSFMRQHWEKIRRKLEEGSYRPSPVRRSLISKPDGTKRKLGIPTVLDRVIQQAITQVLTPVFEPTFSDHSYGYRPGRSAREAVEELQREGNKRGLKCHVVDCDLKSFFDTVDHGKLMDRLRQHVDDPRLLSLIARYLKAGVILLDGTFEETAEGVPQGGPLSPLMANVLLNELDHELEARGHSFVRYADDFVILCRSPRAGRRILDRVRRFLRQRLRLIVNETKSKVVKLSEAAYLGFQILRGRVRWSPKSRKEFKASIRNITGRTRGVSPRRVIEELTLYARGALNYYMIGVNFAEVRELDRWIRRRMRLYYWKQWKRPRTRRRKLLSLGIRRDEVHLASRSRKGPWRMSRNSLINRALSVDWLRCQGVPSLEEQWVAIRYPNGPKRSPR